MTKKRVLIVEDDSVQTMIFEKIVSKVKVKSHQVSTGKEALNYLEENNDIGLVLLDLALPDISGLQVLEELRKTKNKVPVAILSANEDIEIAREAGELGAVKFFIKAQSDLAKLLEFVSHTINKE